MQSIQPIANLSPNYHPGGLKCPRCGCLDTKFCYYNNYNLSQPRFFCKGCRRYWTKGGVLRNVPVGGGSRKAKRSKQKSRDERSTTSWNSSSDSSVVTPSITLETTPITQTEAPPMLDQCSNGNHHLFSEIGEFRSLMASSADELPLGFMSAPDQAEEWGLFDQTYWLNNPDDHQLNYFH